MDLRGRHSTNETQQENADGWERKRKTRRRSN